jgi:hypothetical protein
MALAPRHTFQMLTKRAERMRLRGSHGSEREGARRSRDTSDGKSTLPKE